MSSNSKWYFKRLGSVWGCDEFEWLMMWTLIGEKMLNVAFELQFPFSKYYWIYIQRRQNFKRQRMEEQPRTCGYVGW